MVCDDRDLRPVPKQTTVFAATREAQNPRASFSGYTGRIQYLRATRGLSTVIIPPEKGLGSRGRAPGVRKLSRSSLKPKCLGVVLCLSPRMELVEDDPTDSPSALHKRKRHAGVSESQIMSCASALSRPS